MHKTILGTMAGNYLSQNNTECRRGRCQAGLRWKVGNWELTAITRLTTPGLCMKFSIHTYAVNLFNHSTWGLQSITSQRDFRYLSRLLSCVCRGDSGDPTPGQQLLSQQVTQVPSLNSFLFRMALLP